MLILISSPTKVVDEATLINTLFDEGLDFFHLRKPDDSEQEVEALLDEIHSRNYMKISLHQHHRIADKYGIRRLHLSEHMRRSTDYGAVTELNKMGYNLTTSTHRVDDFRMLDDIYSYAFLGPVFNSISKPGYSANSENFITGKQNIKAIAIGGIQASNISQLKEDFDGVAILGAVWCSSTPIRNFIQIKKAWNTIDQ